jgi:hypothetical protein
MLLNKHYSNYYTTTSPISVPFHSEVDHYVVDYETGCSTQSYPVVFRVVSCFTMLTHLIAYNTMLTWVLLASNSSNVRWVVRCMYPGLWGSFWGLASVMWCFKIKFSISLYWNSNLVNLLPISVVKQIRIEVTDVNPMTKVLPVVLS